MMLRRCANIALLSIIACAIFAIFQASPASNVLRGPPPADEVSLREQRLIAKEKATQLDKHYLSRRIIQAGQQIMDRTPARPAAKAVSAQPISATLVLGRLANETERVAWIFDKVKNIDSYQVYVVDDPDTDGPHLEKNHGREAAVYLTYIIENYETLNDITFFWHSDEVVWHNSLLMSWSSVEALNRMDRKNILKQGYVPSRCDHWPGCPEWIRFNPTTAENRLDPHRNTILRRPKSFYQNLLDWVLDYPSDEESGRVFEFSWPYIFLGKGEHCPSMVECYCKTYNFCLEEPEEIQALETWNSLRTRREEVKWQVAFHEKAIEKKQHKMEDEGASKEEVEAMNDLFQPQLDHLSEELDDLVNTTWHAREEIIHYWKLPPPPVGW